MKYLQMPRITVLCSCGYSSRRSARMVRVGLLECPHCGRTLKPSPAAKKRRTGNDFWASQRLRPRPRPSENTEKGEL